MIDVLIIGAGPAGISAALYAKRAGANVLVLYYGESNVEKSEKIENYYGFENGIEGKTLFNSGIKQAKNLGIEVTNEEVLDIGKANDVFYVETDQKKYVSKTVIIATGNKKLRPNIKGVEEFEGKGVSYCAICDGFFFKNKDVVVIGNGKFAIKEADALKNIVNSVVILTNGEEYVDNIEYKTVNKRIKAILGDNRVSAIEFEDDEVLNCEGVFIAIGEAGSTDFARKLGIMLDGESIIVDGNMKTNVDGLYACGNATKGLQQISKAVYEGSVAGIEAAKYIKEI